MSGRLTDEELNDLSALVERARFEGDPDGETGMLLDDFMDRHAKSIADELRERRAAIRARPATEAYART